MTFSLAFPGYVKKKFGFNSVSEVRSNEDRMRKHTTICIFPNQRYKRSRTIPAADDDQPNLF
ncbi:hypothetical protein T08_14452 [Trichinella sp. T8]|uniref:Uncharacterized protein n=1 Tax=Trichinella murrelli TaxID=144512 RepID=A0A0V0TFE3_9BILA|nr:hypothetical protein T05_13988 [Trichinella murrelli]KRZ85070.1 hypothetical protein T08_14452 [Trichinella sp. T8]